jgi:hypothetical protein
MTLLGDTASYLLCDLDRVSVTDLRRWSRELGLRSCEIAEADGMAVVAARLDGDTDRPGLVHIDPFDRHARAPGGYSALELAARVADSGTGLVYWYGYDQHGAQGEAHKQLPALTTAPLWCGEVTVTGANDSLGELDHSATLCTVGIILANVRAAVHARHHTGLYGFAWPVRDALEEGLLQRHIAGEGLDARAYRGTHGCVQRRYHRQHQRA